jgi:hypothetical protein
MNGDTLPRVTVVAAALDDYATIAEALGAIEEQTARSEIELLVVLDTLDRFCTPADFYERHPGARVIEVGRPLLLNEARAIGILHARAEFVFILEDHCLPDRDCLAAIIRRMRDGDWSVIGPGFVSGNRRSVWARAANLLTYGEWMGFQAAEERAFVAGYSSAWRRESLRNLEPHLERELAIPSRLQQRLRQSGARLLFEPHARMFHWESSYHDGICGILLRQGRGMGYIRRGRDSFGGKLRATLLGPALVGYRTLRGARAWRRTRTTSARVLLALPWLSAVWCAGEIVGYWTRDGEKALRDVSQAERNRQPFIDSEHEPIRRPWL